MFLMRGLVDILGIIAIFRLESNQTLRSFPSIALRIPTAHNFTRD